MAGVIVLSDVVSATTSDLLQGTRLQTVPSGGYLTFEFESNEATSANNFKVSLQMPNGDTPLNGVIIPANPAGTVGVLDDREKMQITLPIQQGGHVVVTLDETGAGTMIYRISYTPA